MHMFEDVLLAGKAQNGGAKIQEPAWFVHAGFRSCFCLSVKVSAGTKETSGQVQKAGSAG